MSSHVIIIDESLNGWEYGMLRSFEKAICTVTGASQVTLPAYARIGDKINHFGQGMNRAKYRRFLPKTAWTPPAGDVAWCILMGPENYRLDLFTGWAGRFGKKILYLYDTMPSQYPVVARIVAGGEWDVLITSFNDAAADLEKMTGRQWHCVEQAADPAVFSAAPFDQRAIGFSSYGRRLPGIHQVVKKLSSDLGLYYDYTTHDGKHPTDDASGLYKQYGWHLSHSIFTFSWPVEQTNPARAGHLSPITCRWFEAAYSGTVLLGAAPKNLAFRDYFPDGLVNAVNPDLPEKQLYEQLAGHWENRAVLFDKAQHMRTELGESITWTARVKQILNLL